MSSSTDNPLAPTNNNPWQPPSPDTLQLWIEVGNKLDRKAIVGWSKLEASLQEARKFSSISREARDFVEKYMVYPSTGTLQLWVEVGNKLDAENSVVWCKAVKSLQEASKFLSISREARAFVETYMGQIIGILLAQQPATVDVNERQCVYESVYAAVTIVAKDLKIQIDRGRRSRSGNPNVVGCSTLEVLGVLFNKEKIYYKDKGTRGDNNYLPGLPQLRLNIVDEFLLQDGFVRLIEYMKDRLIDSDGNGNDSLSNDTIMATTTNNLSVTAMASSSAENHDSVNGHNNNNSNETPSTLPTTALLHQVLTALLDASNSALERNQQQNSPSLKNTTIAVSKTVMQYINWCSKKSSKNTLRKMSMYELTILLNDLHRIFDRFIDTQRCDTYQFYAFWMSLALKLITSQSFPLKTAGWQQLELLIQACENHRPPPRTYAVCGAGCDIVNGTYNFTGIVTEDGYGVRLSNNDIVYERIVPLEEYKEEEQQQQQSNPNDGDGGNNTNNGRSSNSINNRSNLGRGSREKKFTLFRCTMRRGEKWWFLSDADEELPGMDLDIDYYQHKSKEHEEWEPPLSGWITCCEPGRQGINPPPQLEKHGLMVPPGEEQNTLEHQLVKWAIENEIIEILVLGISVHRKIVSRSVPLIHILAYMCEEHHRDETMTTSSSSDNNEEQSQSDKTELLLSRSQNVSPPRIANGEARRVTRSATNNKLRDNIDDDQNGKKDKKKQQYRIRRSSRENSMAYFIKHISKRARFTTTIAEIATTYSCCEETRETAIQKLQDAEFDINKNIDLEQTTKNGWKWTPMIFFSQKGDLSMCLFLLLQGASGTKALKNGWSPMNAAVNNGHLKVLKLLFRHDDIANVDSIKENRFGHTPLSNSIAIGYVSQAEWLILNGGAQQLSERAAHEVRCHIYDRDKSAGQQIILWVNKSIQSNAAFLLFLCGTTINTPTVSAFTATSLSSSSLSSPHRGDNLAEILFQSQSDIRNELDCPICYDYAMNDTIRGEIYQCDSGYHLICGKCKANVHLCPSCRIPMGENRNRALEKVAALLIRPLQFMYGQTAVMELIGEYAGFIHGKELRMLKEFNDLIQIDTEMDEL